MTFRNLVRSTRSIRRFREERRISVDSLLQLVDAARLAPCAANLQKLRFSVVEDREICAEVFPALNWAGYLEDWDGPGPGERPAAYVVIHAPIGESGFTRVDVGVAAAYIVLQAGAEGLGACMIMSFDREGVAAAVGSPEGYRPLLVVALGEPAEKVVLEDPSDSIEYWRDENSVHHVPKLPLDRILH